MFQCWEYGHFAFSCTNKASGRPAWRVYDHELELDLSADDASEIWLDFYPKGSEFPLIGPCVKGCLTEAFEFWEKDVEAPPFAIDIIRQGYSLPFCEFPIRCVLPNNRSALRNWIELFVQSAIIELLEKQLIHEHDSPPLCVIPLSVVEGKKLRLFRDLREVNKCLVKPKIRYEDLQSLISEVFEEGFWFFTWDLKSCCHHVDIFHPFWALRRISRELLDILRLMFTHLDWVPHVFVLPSFCAL